MAGAAGTFATFAHVADADNRERFAACRYLLLGPELTGQYRRALPQEGHLWADCGPDGAGFQFSGAMRLALAVSAVEAGSGLTFRGHAPDAAILHQLLAGIVTDLGLDMGTGRRFGIFLRQV